MIKQSKTETENENDIKNTSVPDQQSGSNQKNELETTSKCNVEQATKNATLTTILSQPVHDVFVQYDKSFRRTDRKHYERMLEARTNEMTAVSLSESMESALTVQIIFHNISLIIQGFLSGFGTCHAIFAIVFADTDIFRKNFTWLAVPTQVIFYVGFVISTIAAFDRFEMGSGIVNNLKRVLSMQAGSLGIVICLIGTIVTLISTVYDQWLVSPIEQRRQIQNIINTDPTITWRWLSGIRALAALISWLLLALSPNDNFLLTQIRNPKAGTEEP